MRKQQQSFQIFSSRRSTFYDFVTQKKETLLMMQKNFISQESKTLGYHLQGSSIGSQFRLARPSLFGV